MCSSLRLFQKLEEQTGGFHERTNKRTVGIFVVSQWPDQRLPTLITNSSWVPISDTRMTTGAYQHVAPDHVVNGGEGHEASLCKEQYWMHTHSPSLLSQMSFQHPSLFVADIVRGAQINCLSPIANYAMNSWLLLCLFDQPDQTITKQSGAQLIVVLYTIANCANNNNDTAEKTFFSVIIVCNTRCTTNCLSFPTCTQRNSTQVHLLYGSAPRSLTHSLTHSCNVIHC